MAYCSAREKSSTPHLNGIVFRFRVISVIPEKIASPKRSRVKQDRPEMTLMEMRLFGIYFNVSPLGSFPFFFSICTVQGGTMPFCRA